MRNLGSCNSTPTSGAEQAVASVAKAGNDIALLVEVVVHGSREDRQVGIEVVNVADAFGGGDEVDETHPGRATLGEQVEGSDGAAAGGEHRVDEDHFEVTQVMRKALVIHSGFQSLFVAL